VKWRTILGGWMDPDWQGSSGTFGPTEQERIRILFSSSASFRNLQGKEGWESGRGKTNAMFGPRFMAIVAQSGQLHLGVGWGGAGSVSDCPMVQAAKTKRCQGSSKTCFLVSEWRHRWRCRVGFGG